MTPSLSPEQKDIIDTDGNVVVSASAGAGKTFTLVKKIENDIKNNRSHKVIAAITFTIKAANEIRDRLLVTSDEHFVGTNNSFAIEEVIKPFMRDFYGKDYKVDMSTDYGIKKNSFEEAIEEIRTKGIICVLNNKENFIFKLALKIVKNSFACREYLKAKYFKIYVDEYQDCDRDMHEFFMYICDELNIECFIVGDAKQSIYMWRGAYPDAFKSIWDKKNFSKKILSYNYRSCLAIQNYSNILCKETRGYFISTDDVSAIKLIVANETNWNKMVLNELNNSFTTAVLRYTNDNAKLASHMLSTVDNPFIYIQQPPICEITTNSAWIYKAIAEYFIVERYSIYDFLQIIPGKAADNRKIKSYIENILEHLKEDLENCSLAGFESNLRMLAEYFGYEVKKEHINQLYSTITDNTYHNYFFQNNIQNVALTFHSSKGLEFDQVIIFAEDYNLENEASIYNHYVAVTRARNKLIIVYLNGEADKCFSDNLNRIMIDSKLKYTDLFEMIH